MYFRVRGGRKAKEEGQEKVIRVGKYDQNRLCDYVWKCSNEPIICKHIAV